MLVNRESWYDHGSKALICFISAQRDAFEVFEFAEEVLDEVAPSVDLFINDQWCQSFWPLRNNDSSAPLIEFMGEPIVIECFVSEQIFKIDAIDEWRNTTSIIAVENKANKIAQRCV